MKNIQTKSGFAWNVDERVVGDWDFLDQLCDSESEDKSLALKASRNCVKMLLGADGASALAEHVKDKDGIKNSAKVFEEFKEIMTLLGKSSKKSQPSQP
ncbi:MAG: hypothetical protein IKE94_04775 [Aeriscardovia sp.]|nr:hypothetical protein [Aeriscardovia sp.]